MASDQQPRLIVLDVASLLHRAYHGVPQHFTSASGEPTNAVFGFTNTLLRIVDEIEPTHAAAAFDLPGKTFRHDQFADYKAGRPDPDESLIVQFRRVRQLIDALGIPAYELEGYEADDLLGTLACQAERVGFEVLLVTGDQDAYQLVTANVRVLSSNPRTGKQVIHDAVSIRERWGVRPDQVVDFKGLSGDSSDNIPGVRGIGEKTAARLLQQFANIDEVYAHLQDVSPATRRRLDGQQGIAELSRDLARIVTDLPVRFDPDRTRLWQADAHATSTIMHELQFRSLLDRLPLNMVEPPVGNTPVSSPTEPEIIRTTGMASTLAERLAKLKLVGIFPLLQNTRTGPNLCGLGLAWDGGSAYLPGGPSGTRNLESLRPWIESDKHAKVIFDSKLLQRSLAGHQMTLRGVANDLMLAAYLTNTDAPPQTLDDLVSRQLGQTLYPPMVEAPEPNTLAIAPPEQASQALAVRANACLQLAQELQKELDEQEVAHILRDVEIPLAAVLATIEGHGVAIDVPALRELSRKLQQEIDALANVVHKHAGRSFNINSPKQLRSVLFETLKLPTGRKTKSGYSTASSVLEQLVDAHPIVQHVLDYRTTAKLKSTYADALADMVVPETGRLHTSFNQAVTATGRLSSANPNLQNIPIRTQRGREIRRSFVSGSDNLALLAIDYSQIELRVLAHVSQDAAMCQAFHQGKDIHATTAAYLHGVSIDEVSPSMRRVAKATNFGIVYGMTAQGLMQRTDMDFDTAQAFIDSYFSTYPGVKAYMDRTVAEAHERGFAKTMLGRRRYLPGLKAHAFHERSASERIAINMPIQGAAADIIKIAMIDLDRKLLERGLSARILLQVHDELVLEVPHGELEAVLPLSKASMAETYPLRVPLVVDARVGADWRDMRKI